jgi:hypothetical protein
MHWFKGKFQLLLAGGCLVAIAACGKQKIVEEQAPSETPAIESITTPRPHRAETPIENSEVQPQPTVTPTPAETQTPEPGNTSSTAAVAATPVPSPTVAAQVIATQQLTPIAPHVITPAPDVPTTMQAIDQQVNKLVQNKGAALNQSDIEPLSVHLGYLTRLAQDPKYTDAQRQKVGEIQENVDKLMSQAMHADSPEVRQKAIEEIRTQISNMETELH